MGTASARRTLRADPVPERSPARDETESNTATVAARKNPRKSLPLESLLPTGYLHLFATGVEAC